MKIGDTKPNARVLKYAPAAAQESGSASGAAPRQIADSANILGIPENELTPKVRDAIMTLMAEVDRMRGEIEEQRARIAYLERLADQVELHLDSEKLKVLCGLPVEMNAD